MNATSRTSIRIVLAAIVVLAATPFPTRAQTDPVMLGRAVAATVQVGVIVEGTVDGEPQSLWYGIGSGTIVSADGFILTSRHVISAENRADWLAEILEQFAAEGSAAELEVDPNRFMIAVSDGRHLPEARYIAALAAEDAALDLAVLHVESDELGAPLSAETLNLAALPLGDSNAVNLGDPIHVFGFPVIGKGSLTYTPGVASSFLFADEIDGIAWINTDAVTSGGNSGGAAVNDAGELIGVPTSGSPIDCRPAVEVADAEGQDCVPTGGSLTRLRPIALAMPLLASVDPGLTQVATDAGAGVTPRNELATNTAAAEGCAARGDWRCAANFYTNALALAPGDNGLGAALYDAYLALGEQEAAAGRLDSARTAYSQAAALDPARPQAAAAVERIAPYRRALNADNFNGPQRFASESDSGERTEFGKGALTIEVSEPGRITWFPFSPTPLAGEDYAALVHLTEISGDGNVIIQTRTGPQGEAWLFAVDPAGKTWQVMGRDAASGKFVTAAGPFDLAPAVSWPLESIEVRVRDGFPLLYINGVDVVAGAGAVLPEVGNEGSVDFGVSMSPEGSLPVRVTFDAIGLYELT